MKIILGANISANGKILLGENPDHFVPQAAIDSLIKIATQAGNLIIGRKTFEFMAQFPGGIREMLPGLEIVLMSSDNNLTQEFEIANSTEEAIKYLSKNGFTEIAVGGGTGVYNAFLDADLVTDVRFNIIPVIVGEGGILGTKQSLSSTFGLAEHKLLSDGVVHLHLIRGK